MRPKGAKGGDKGAKGEPKGRRSVPKGPPREPTGVPKGALGPPRCTQKAWVETSDEKRWSQPTEKCQNYSKTYGSGS